MERVDVLVVGAGLNGLIAAAEATKRGKSVVVLEASRGAVGGVWASYANTRSRLQTPETSYRLEQPASPPEPGEVFPCRDDILERARAFAEHYSLDIRAGARATSVLKEASIGAYVVRYTEDGSERTIHASVVVLCPGNLQGPRRLAFPGEELFLGLVGYGIADDVGEPAAAFAGRRVVIVGCGSFAAENTREALLAGAERVTVVARNLLTTMPRHTLAYAHLAALPLLRTLVASEHRVIDSVPLGRADFMKGNYRDGRLTQGALPPVSDFAFLALHTDRVRHVQGAVQSVGPKSVTLDSGETIEADVLLKCVGFEPPDPVMKELVPDFTHLRGIWVNGRADLVYWTEVRFTSYMPVVPFVDPSTLAFGRIAASLAMLFAFERRRLFERWVVCLMPRTWRFDVCVPHALGTLAASACGSASAAALILRQGAADVRAAHAAMGGGRWQSLFAADWYRQAAKLGMDPPPKYPFPLEPPAAWERLQLVIVACAAAFSHVLAAVGRVLKL